MSTRIFLIGEKTMAKNIPKTIFFVEVLKG